MSRPSSSEHPDPIEAYCARVDRMVLALGVIGILAALIAAVLAGWLVATLSGSGLLGLVIAAVVAVVAAGWFIGRIRAWHGASILERLSAQPIDEMSYPRVWNLVEGLCLRSGVEVPQLLLVPDDQPNALVLGGNERQRGVVFTSAALEVFDRIELEAVVAWLVSRLRSGEAERSLRLAGLIDALPIPDAVVSTMRARVGVEDLVALHDQAACSLTRYPPGLLGALERAREAADGSPDSDGVMTQTWTLDEAQLWFVPPKVHRVTDTPGQDVAFDSALDERITTTRDL